MSLLEFFKGKGPSGFGFGSTAKQVTAGLSLSGKTVLVTGCNSGLGSQATFALSDAGVRIIGVARSLEKAKEACQNLPGKSIPIECDLSNPTSVRNCVTKIQQQNIKLDAIICNAGIMALPTLQQAYGIELQFFTNHIGHFMLVTGLLNQIKPEGRIVMLSSAAHTMAPKGNKLFADVSGTKNYSPWGAYGQAKIANLLFAKELSRRFAGTRKTANAVHPGVINTNISRHLNPLARTLFGAMKPIGLKSPAQGAATEVYVAVHPSAAKISGEYFADCNISKSRADTNDPALAKRLWDISEKIVASL